MKILVVGGGGREHAIIWKINQSSKVSKIYCAPGNGGICDIAECVDIGATDVDGIVEFVKNNQIDLTVVAPDDPLALGMVNALEKEGLKAFGPTREAARIESSKVFSKKLMKKYNIPTAGYKVFDDFEKGKEYLENADYPLVIKADGLALGKGVIIAQNRDQAGSALEDIMVEKVFGESGNQVIIEEFLSGPEVSILTFTDGKTIVPMVSSQDHKRAFDGDKGPNTGGMGTFSPSRVYTPEIAAEVEKTILRPTVEAMNLEGCPFKGVLYFGLILTQKGVKVLEYNARFGDPETQVVLPRLKTDLVDIFMAIIDGDLDKIDIQWQDNASVCVILASGGYPKSYQKGYEISGIEAAAADSGIIVFHSGTKKENGKYYTNGGRVLGVTAVAPDLNKAIKKAYRQTNQIHFNDMHYRKDIGVK